MSPPATQGLRITTCSVKSTAFPLMPSAPLLPSWGRGWPVTTHRKTAMPLRHAPQPSVFPVGVSLLGCTPGPAAKFSPKFLPKFYSSTAQGRASLRPGPEGTPSSLPPLPEMPAPSGALCKHGCGCYPLTQAPRNAQEMAHVSQTGNQTSPSRQLLSYSRGGPGDRGSRGWGRCWQVSTTRFQVLIRSSCGLPWCNPPSEASVASEMGSWHRAEDVDSLWPPGATLNPTGTAGLTGEAKGAAGSLSLSPARSLVCTYLCQVLHRADPSVCSNVLASQLAGRPPCGDLDTQGSRDLARPLPRTPGHCPAPVFAHHLPWLPVEGKTVPASGDQNLQEAAGRSLISKCSGAVFFPEVFLSIWKGFPNCLMKWTLKARTSNADISWKASLQL